LLLRKSVKYASQDFPLATDGEPYSDFPLATDGDPCSDDPGPLAHYCPE